MRDVWSALGIKKDYKILNRWSSCKTRLDWVLLSQNKQSLSLGQASRFCLWLFVNDIQKPEPKCLQEYLRQSREHIRSELALFILKPRAPLRRSVLDPWQPRHLAVQLWAPRRLCQSKLFWSEVCESENPATTSFSCKCAVPLWVSKRQAPQ